MSMIYCHEHDRHVDTDFFEDCPECLAEIYAVEESPTVELIRNDRIARSDATLWTVAAKAVSEASKANFTMPDRDWNQWYVVYQSTDMLRVMKDAMELAQTAGEHHVYAVGVPLNLED